MEDYELKQTLAEIIRAQEIAFEILAQAIGESGAPEILAVSVRAALAEHSRAGPLPGGLAWLVRGILAGLEKGRERGTSH